MEPETPVSISSKMIVGSFTAPAIMAFSESMTRAISPPDATEATFCNVPFLLAENRNVTLSIPLLSGSLRGFSSTTKRTLGIPRGTSRLCICLSMCLPDWERSFVNTAACFITLSYSVSFWAVSSAIRSSKEVMAFSFS